MKAEIINGILVITPENYTEEFALKIWESINTVSIADLTKEDLYVKRKSIALQEFN